MPAVATPPVEEPPTATNKSVAFVVVADDVCRRVVFEPPVSDPLALWSTLQVTPEYSAMYKFESPVLSESVAVTVKLLPDEIPDAQ